LFGLWFHVAIKACFKDKNKQKRTY